MISRPRKKAICSCLTNKMKWRDKENVYETIRNRNGSKFIFIYTTGHLHKARIERKTTNIFRVEIQSRCWSMQHRNIRLYCTAGLLYRYELTDFNLFSVLRTCLTSEPDNAPVVTGGYPSQNIFSCHFYEVISFSMAWRSNTTTILLRNAHYGSLRRSLVGG